MPLVKLIDLQALRIRAFHAGALTATDIDWPIDKVVAKLCADAETIGLDPKDPQLEWEIHHHVQDGVNTQLNHEKFQREKAAIMGDRAKD